MTKKTAGKSKAAKSVSLPAKKLRPKTAGDIKGGSVKQSTESVSMPYGGIEWTYTKQKPS